MLIAGRRSISVLGGVPPAAWCGRVPRWGDWGPNEVGSPSPAAMAAAVVVAVAVAVTVTVTTAMMPVAAAAVAAGTVAVAVTMTMAATMAVAVVAVAVNMAVAVRSAGVLVSSAGGDQPSPLSCLQLWSMPGGAPGQ